MCVCAELNARLVQVVGMGSVSKSEPESEAGILMRRGEARGGEGETRSLPARPCKFSLFLHHT